MKNDTVISFTSDLMELGASHVWLLIGSFPAPSVFVLLQLGICKVFIYSASGDTS